MTTRPLRCAILARYSSNAQHERSAEDQIDLCRVLAKRNGWTVLEDWVVADRAKSGATVHGRTGFLRLQAAARLAAPPFDVIIVDDYTRVSREADIAISVFKDLTARGIRIVGASDGFDSDRKSAKLEVMFKGAIAEQYLDDLAEKTHRGQRGQFLRNFHTGGRLYGYRTDPVYATGANPLDPRAEPEGYVLRIEPAEAEVVRQIFEKYVTEKLSVNEISRQLNQAGIAAPSAGTARSSSPGWSHSSVLARIDNEAYAGRFVWNQRDWYRDRETGRRRYVERPKSEWVERMIPDLAIVSLDVWKAAQVRREAARRKYPGFGQSPRRGSIQGQPIRHLLSGLLVCSECGHNMQVVGGKGDSRSYGCATHKKSADLCSNGASISKAKVEETVFGGLRRELSHPDFLARMARKAAEALRERRTDPAAEIAQLVGEQKKLSAEVDRLVDLLAGGLGDSATLARHVKEREQRLAELQAQVDEIKARPRTADVLPSPQLIGAFIKRLDELLTADQPAARRLLETHVGKITLTPKSDGPKPIYWASGRFSFGPNDPRAELVAGAGFEPATFGL